MVPDSITLSKNKSMYKHVLVLVLVLTINWFKKILICFSFFNHFIFPHFFDYWFVNTHTATSILPLVQHEAMDT
jgi:hypothetical protein